MRYFREQVAGEYFDAGFDGEGETLMLVHGHVRRTQAAAFAERLQRVGEDFSQQHLADRRAGGEPKAPYTLVVAMRSWVLGAFRDLERER